MSELTDTERDSWLKYFTMPGAPTDRSEASAMCRHPWIVAWQGKDYAAACDGRCILLTPCSDGYERATVTGEQRWLDFFNPPKGSNYRSVDVDILRLWTGDACDTDPRECTECYGSGRTVCDECDQDRTCPECDGDGVEFDCREKSPGQIGGLCVDRARLATLTKHFAGNVQWVVNHKTELLIIHDDSHWACLMACQGGESETDAPTLESVILEKTI